MRRSMDCFFPFPLRARLVVAERNLSHFGETYEANTYGLSENDDLPKRLASFIAFAVTQSTEIESDAGEISVQEVSTFSPLHVMCSDLFQPFDLTLKVIKNNSLPYQMRGRRKCDVLEIKKYATSIRNAVSAWHTESLNELGEEEKDIVKNLSPHQVACFSKMIEEKNAHTLPLYRHGFLPRGLETFAWQLGSHAKSLEVNGGPKEVLGHVLGSVPVLIHSLEPVVSYCRPRPSDCMMLQASVQTDNWFALQGGIFPFTSTETQGQQFEAESQRLGHHFRAQKSLELWRLQYEVATSKGRTARPFRKIKFLGCIMEVVRSSLAFYLHTPPHTTESESFGGEHMKWNSSKAPTVWTFPILRESQPVFCSDQLRAVLREADQFHRKSLQMRLVWEIQLDLIRKRAASPSSPSLMMLCMLGYPSLQISKVHYCKQAHDSSWRGQSNVEGVSNGDTMMPLGPLHDSCRTRSSQMFAVTSANSMRKCSEVNDVCVRIDIVEAPQPLHIIFQWNSVSNNATVQIGCNEGHVVPLFCWQSWKDGFMGRICAHSEWRSTRIRNTDEKIRQEASLSKLSAGFPSEDTLKYWQGWPPFLSEITGFERYFCDHLRTSGRLRTRNWTVFFATNSKDIPIRLKLK